MTVIGCDGCGGCGVKSKYDNYTYTRINKVFNKRYLSSKKRHFMRNKRYFTRNKNFLLPL